MIVPSRSCGARSRSQAFHAQLPIALMLHKVNCATITAPIARPGGRNTASAISANMLRPIRLLITAMRLRWRSRSTSKIAGPCSSWLRKGALARMPIMMLLAPRCSAKAVRITPLVSALVALENTASLTRRCRPASSSGSLIACCGASPMPASLAAPALSR
jgi:hypothetical protein